MTPLEYKSQSSRVWRGYSLIEQASSIVAAHILFLMEMRLAFFPLFREDGLAKLSPPLADADGEVPRICQVS